MKVKDLIIQLLNEDMDSEVAIECNEGTVRDYEHLDGIANFHPKFSGVLLVSDKPIYNESGARRLNNEK